MEKDNLISISEAAKLLRVSVMTLRRWDESGRLSPVRKQPKGYRYYRKEDIDIFLNDLFGLGRKWAIDQVKFPGEYYCQNSAVFQANLVEMQNLMIRKNNLGDILSLVVSIAGEIGNNSFDHNLGQWPDEPGIFFGYDLNKRQIVLADRGLGILKTLKRAKPELKDHKEALLVAFTETISGRAPENRGNGLKYVRKVISENMISLLFQSGNAILKMEGKSQELKITETEKSLCGCLALITY
jgi:excisionase family DNA binding protein